MSVLARSFAQDCSPPLIWVYAHTAGIADCTQCEYRKVDHVEHILLRPDSYVGSTEPMTTSSYVFDAGENEGRANNNHKLTMREITYVPALVRSLHTALSLLLAHITNHKLKLFTLVVCCFSSSVFQISTFRTWLSSLPTTVN